MPTVIDHFDVLTSKGLKIIPLKENTKVPMCKGWTQNWNLHRNREKLKTFPNSNLGILLGEVVDVEGDSDKANKEIIDLIGDYPHPTYQSSKSVHHLFRTPDNNLRHLRIGDIEFRGHGHQSVIPPSQHQGYAYKWLYRFTFPIPEMPVRLKSFYEKHRKTLVTRKPCHKGTQCSICGKDYSLHEKRLKLEKEVFCHLKLRWQCKNCRSFDVRPAVRYIKSMKNVVVRA